MGYEEWFFCGEEEEVDSHMLNMSIFIGFLDGVKLSSAYDHCCR